MWICAARKVGAFASHGCMRGWSPRCGMHISIAVTRGQKGGCSAEKSGRGKMSETQMRSKETVYR